eukprot:6947079-Alexandrium_andersonii.AAC.1
MSYCKLDYLAPSLAPLPKRSNNIDFKPNPRANWLLILAPLLSGAMIRWHDAQGAQCAGAAELDDRPWHNMRQYWGRAGERK